MANSSPLNNCAKKLEAVDVTYFILTYLSFAKSISLPGKTALILIPQLVHRKRFLGGGDFHLR